MSIKQLSVFLENRAGALESFTRLLGENFIDLIALSIADTTDFGILRVIVDDTDRALELVKGAGYTANITDVLAVTVPDSPGGLASVLEILREGDISIEYIYSFVRRVGRSAVIIFRVDQPEATEELLAGSGIRMLTPSEVAAARNET